MKPLFGSVAEAWEVYSASVLSDCSEAQREAAKRIFYGGASGAFVVAAWLVTRGTDERDAPKRQDALAPLANELWAHAVNEITATSKKDEVRH